MVAAAVAAVIVVGVPVMVEEVAVAVLPVELKLVLQDGGILVLAEVRELTAPNFQDKIFSIKLSV